MATGLPNGCHPSFSFCVSRFARSDGDAALTETFLRMGVDELSMNAKSILPVRKIIRSVDLSKPSEK